MLNLSSRNIACYSGIQCLVFAFEDVDAPHNLIAILHGPSTHSLRSFAQDNFRLFSEFRSVQASRLVLSDRAKRGSRSTAPLGLEPRQTDPESVVLPITPQGKI